MDEKRVNKLLWLDDIRNPYLNEERRVPAGREYSIDWVLNYDQFIKWIEKFGLPDAISFDHDLALEHYTPEKYWDDYDASKEYQDAQNYKERTGKDCADWLVNHCQTNGLELPLWFVHSANPVGADNIKAVLKTFMLNKTIDARRDEEDPHDRRLRMEEKYGPQNYK